MKPSKVIGDGNELVMFIIAFFVIITILIKYDSLTSKLIVEESAVDNNGHLVQNLPDKDKAADMIAMLKKKTSLLSKKMLEKYPNKKNVKRLYEKFNPDNIMESDSNSKHTSYSINKGEKIVICLRSKDEKKKLIDPNTVMFVTLHELSHIMTKSIGHTDEFWKNFKFILKEAIQNNIYNCVDYKINPQKYCGIQVTDNPISCATLS
jgi:Skp family chaperone for outer membrane proteins